ncbi:hypothetical protein [Massilia sp. CF038]|uniref:hypothetical protein n=1 Tax=Massilia sp. CF038 TaxID=1881045 RepID=UPI000910E8CA|nr:hypothetical protein [Massilia sp. CF038]SHG71513.1 hypothetical protein SAMN05428948_1735 [Massilia sp. CF038]
MRERAISSVPLPALALLGLALLAQLAWHAMVPPQQNSDITLSAPPSLSTLRLAALGDPVALSKLLMLQVQAADSQGGNVALGRLDYQALEAWLERVADLDPKAAYPMFVAGHIYAEGGDMARKRQMLEFVYRRFLLDPKRHWGALAYVTMVAKHQLHDLPLALRYARALRQEATSPKVPSWASQMELFVLEDMNELESAKILAGAMLASGQLTDPNERAFLNRHLKALNARTGAK